MLSKILILCNGEMMVSTGDRQIHGGASSRRPKIADDTFDELKQTSFLLLVEDGRDDANGSAVGIYGCLAAVQFDCVIGQAGFGYKLLRVFDCLQGDDVGARMEKVSRKLELHISVGYDGVARSVVVAGVGV